MFELGEGLSSAIKRIKYRLTKNPLIVKRANVGIYINRACSILNIVKEYSYLQT